MPLKMLKAISFSPAHQWEMSESSRLHALLELFRHSETLRAVFASACLLLYIDLFIYSYTLLFTKWISTALQQIKHLWVFLFYLKSMTYFYFLPIFICDWKMCCCFSFSWWCLNFCYCFFLFLFFFPVSLHHFYYATVLKAVSPCTTHHVACLSWV